MLSDTLKIILVVAIPTVFMGSLCTALLVYTRLRKRKQPNKQNHSPIHRSFQPSIKTNDPNWAHASLPPPPRPEARPDPGLTPSTSTSTARRPSQDPVWSDHIIDIPRIGPTKDRDTRQRLQSIVSTLSNHTLPANPSFEALEHYRADRIGSIDDRALRRGSQRPGMMVYGDGQGRKKSGTSTLASLSAPSVGSFTIENAQRASLSVRKISAGGFEKIMSYTSGTGQVAGEPCSPTNLDERFAKPVSVPGRPPSRIDFTQPFGDTRRQGDHLVAAKQPFRTRSPDSRANRDSSLSYTMVPVPEKPVQESPTLTRPSNRDRLPIINHDPLISPTTLSMPADPVPIPVQSQGDISPITTTTPSRSTSTKKKRRPDSIILAHLRSPKHGAHLTISNQSSDSPSSKFDALHNLNPGIATSVLGMKSPGGSTNFPFSQPVSPTSGAKNDPPKTPRTATSEGCPSAVSDLESAQLFHAWKGFAPPVPADKPVGEVKRGLSVQGQTEGRPRPGIPRRAGTQDGGVAVEIVLDGNTLSRHH